MDGLKGGRLHDPADAHSVTRISLARPPAANKAKSILANALGVLFPPRCAACGEFLGSGERGLCGDCRDTLVEFPDDACPVCAIPGCGGMTCRSCAESPPPFAKAYAAYLHGGALGDVIHRLKYQDRPGYAPLVAELCAHAAGDALAWCTLVAPIPLHPSRLLLRGYNQAALVACLLAKGHSPRIPVALQALERTIATSPQVGQGRERRKSNVKGAFQADRRRVAGQRLLLVDDVMTTGATLEEASIAALSAGAAEVRTFCVARAFG